MSELDDLLDPGVKQGSTPGNYSQQPIPNSAGVLVLGILSIVTCVFYGVPGLICGIIALVLHKKVKAIYLSDPLKYDGSYKNAKAGMVCAIIGVSLSAIWLLYLIFVLVAIGTMSSSFGRY
ncbi:MAG: hypothetical protein ACI837_001558 [Crocinitomicaceae bacterium]|jgi:hypothetical protein